MKKNIVVCCSEMLAALCMGGLVYDGKFAISAQDPRIRSDFRHCPYCGKVLPFPYEEAE